MDINISREEGSIALVEYFLMLIASSIRDSVSYSFLYRTVLTKVLKDFSFLSYSFTYYFEIAFSPLETK